MNQLSAQKGLENRAAQCTKKRAGKSTSSVQKRGWEIDQRNAEKTLSALRLVAPGSPPTQTRGRSSAAQLHSRAGAYPERRAGDRLRRQVFKQCCLDAKRCQTHTSTRMPRRAVAFVYLLEKA